MNMLGCAWHRCTYDFELEVITRLSIFQDSTALYWSNMIAYACHGQAISKCPEFLCTIMNFHMNEAYCRASCSVYTAQKSAHSKTPLLSMACPPFWAQCCQYLCWYPSSLEHQTGSISLVESLKRFESTAVIVSPCFRSIHSTVPLQITGTSFQSRFTQHFYSTSTSILFLVSLTSFILSTTVTVCLYIETFNWQEFSFICGPTILRRR